ncbi:hypothetical protein MtrunA17_Chr4g0007771 [Medicago truncatula]|uniref:Transmembrane protein n=1 Tax=Medicago truncatula TaxID=3880 RepID=A0A396I2F7_MEDTR|nr:hypothetical protein MtrunA17_Chr4g0007771 [Medicago truncatula]
MILNFCIDRFCGFQPIRIIIFFLYVSNFCMGRPFGFSVHRDALFLPKPPFPVCDLSSFFILTKYFLTASVFTGHTSLPSFFVLGIHCPWNSVNSDSITFEHKATLLTFMGTSLLLLKTCFMLLIQLSTPYGNNNFKFNQA